MTDDSRSPEPSPSQPEPPPRWAEADEDDGRDPPAHRGLMRRLLGAFSGGDAEEEAASAPAGAAQAAHGQAPGMVNLRRMRVDDVAVPKVEIVAAPITATLPDLVEMFREHGFSRMPVYRGTLDNPLGMIHLKDLALKHGFGMPTPVGRFALRPLLRPLLYVPPSMPIGILLQQMQHKRTHMALVIDEYGGVDGLVTIEDLIEQVIGQIEDEHDEIEGSLVIQEKPGQWLIQARAPLEEVAAATGLALAAGEEGEEVDTLGGLIFMLTGRVPVRGEVIPVESGAEFEIVDADARRIKRVRLRAPRLRTETPRLAEEE